MTGDAIALCLREMEKGGSFLLLAEDKLRLRDLMTEISAYLVCSEPDKNFPRACGMCANCRIYGRGEHPDVFRLQTKGRSATIPISEIRTLKEKINLKPYQAKRKVFLLDEAERLRTEAANAFLKTLEEPPYNAVLILGASSVNSLLPTVISRCKIMRGLALDGPEAAEDETFQNLLKMFFAGVRERTESSFMDEVLSLERPQCEYFLEHLALVLRDLLMRRIAGDNASRTGILDSGTLSTLDDLFAGKDLESAVFRVLEIKNAVKSNVNIKLSMDLLFKDVVKSTMQTALY